MWNGTHHCGATDEVLLEVCATLRTIFNSKTGLKIIRQRRACRCRFPGGSIARTMGQGGHSDDGSLCGRRPCCRTRDMPRLVSLLTLARLQASELRTRTFPPHAIVPSDEVTLTLPAYCQRRLIFSRIFVDFVIVGRLGLRRRWLGRTRSRGLCTSRYLDDSRRGRLCCLRCNGSGSLRRSDLWRRWCCVGFLGDGFVMPTKQRYCSEYKRDPDQKAASRDSRLYDLYLATPALGAF